MQKDFAEPGVMEFSFARYQPLANLMSDGDLQFLRAQPGFRPEMGKKFVRERRRIFRLYLRQLAWDFHQMHAQARLLAAALPADDSGMIGVLLRQQARFWYEMTAIELRLSFAWSGFAALDARRLVEAVGAMHAELSRLAAPAAA